MNKAPILLFPYSFEVYALSSKTTTREFLRLSQKFFRNDQLINQLPTRFLLGITENPGEFWIDLKNALTCVEQNDGFWHARKQPIEEGPLGKRVQRNVGAFASFPHSGNCSAACKENNSRQNVRRSGRTLRFLTVPLLLAGPVGLRIKTIIWRLPERPMGHRLGYAFSGCAPSARSRRIHSRT